MKQTKKLLSEKAACLEVGQYCLSHLGKAELEAPQIVDE